MIEQADVVIENFSPRVMDQFGLGAEVLLELNPRLVMVRMPAFGLTGPWRDRVGFAPTMEQIAGLAWVTGMPDELPVAPRGACDPFAGTHAAFALMAALEFTDRTGRGQLVEVAMIESVLNVTAVQPMEFEMFGSILERRGNKGHHPGVTQDIYRCAGDDNWIAIAVRNDDERDALATLMGGAASDPAQWLATQDAATVVERLVAAGIPAAVVISPSLVIENPQLIHRGFFEPLTHPSTGPGLYPCPPFARPDGVDALAAPSAPDAGPAQHRGADRAVRAEEDPISNASPLTASSAPGRKGFESAGCQGDRHSVEDRHVVRQVGMGDLRGAQMDVVRTHRAARRAPRESRRARAWRQGSGGVRLRRR